MLLKDRNVTDCKLYSTFCNNNNKTKIVCRIDLKIIISNRSKSNNDSGKPIPIKGNYKAYDKFGILSYNVTNKNADYNR